MWGNSEARPNATTTGKGTDTTCNNRRSHTLAQWGGVIWDLSGNVWEYVNKANTIGGNGFNMGQTSVAGASSPTGWDDDGVYAATDMQKYGAASWVGTAWGMWNILSAQGVGSNIFVRGGRAGDSLNAGVFGIFLYWTAGSRWNNIGFRCAK
jgi:hypothetical protein